MSGLFAIGLIALVGVFAWVLRRNASPASPSAATTPGSSTDAADPADEELEGPEEELAVTSNGDVFIPDGAHIRLMALNPDEPEMHREDVEAGLVPISRQDRLQLIAQRGKPGSLFSPGDFTAARVQRGAAGVVPWCVETLGRDGEFIPFAFETEDGARAAFDLFERYDIVRRPLDEDGQPIPPSVEDWEEGRRRYDESWQALTMDSDPGEGLEPGSYSDRR
jgi:hypothetical protein